MNDDQINILKRIGIYILIILIIGTIIFLCASFMYMFVKAVNTPLPKYPQTRKEQIEYNQLYHPKAVTLHESVVAKNFSPYYGFKWRTGTDAKDLGKQVDGYLKSIKNIDDYTVRVTTTSGDRYGTNSSETVVLNRKDK